MNREKTEKFLKIGLFGALLTLVGDLLIGAAKFPDGANMIDGYFAIALGYLLYFLLPVTVVFAVFFSSITTPRRRRRSKAGSTGSTSKASC